MTTALQFLNVEWNTKHGNKSISALSEGVARQDAEYISGIAKSVFPKLTSEKDEENPLSANIMYILLPSGGTAVLRSGYFESEDPEKSECRIIHAFIRPSDAEYQISPMLYVSNNCFIESLDAETEKKIEKENILPQISFPKAQYKLNQSEVEKFFSPHRQRTLEILIQSVIDAHGNSRKIIFNDTKYSNLKYWFWGIHRCLPRQILESLTYSTNAFEKNPDIKLTCGSKNNNIDNVTEINDGNFVIDLCGSESCSDIEAVKYSTSTVKMFVEDMDKAEKMIRGIEALIERHELSLSSATNIYNLLNGNFDSFDAVYDIRYSLDKLSTLEPERIPCIISNLWECVKERRFKFPINENLIPLLSFIFKNSDKPIKREIADLIYKKTAFFGISRERSLAEYAEQIRHNVPFIWDYLPYSLLSENILEQYVSSVDDIMRSGALLFMIIDNMEALCDSFGREMVYSSCRYIISDFYQKESLEMLISVIERCSTLPDEFLIFTVIGAFKMLKRDTPDIIDRLGDVFVFSVIESLIDRPSVAAPFVAEYAREGYYSDLILTYYYGLMQKYPQQTDKITEILKKDPRYTQFVSDLALYVFTNNDSTTKDDVIRYCKDYYIKGFDRSNIFEKKLSSYLNSLIPVIQIRESEYFLRFIQDNSVNDEGPASVQSLLFDYIARQNLSDIYDYYNVNRSEYTDTKIRLRRVKEKLTAQFEAARLCFDIADLCSDHVCVQNDENYSKAVLLLRSYAIFCDLDGKDGLKDDFIRILFRSFMNLALKLYNNEEDCFILLRRLFSQAENEPVFIKLLKNYIEAGAKENERVLSVIVMYSLTFPENSSDILSAFENYIYTFSQKDKRKIYNNLVSVCVSTADRERLTEYLLDLYYRPLSFLSRLFSTPRKKMRKKLLSCNNKK